MEKSQKQRRKQGGSSPNLLRSKSSSTAALMPSPLPKTSISSKIEARTIKREEVAAAVAVAAAAHGGGGFVRFLPRSTSKVEVPRRKRSASTSPSAWALSPGRSLPSFSPAPVPKSPASSEKLMNKQEGRSGVTGVLKYFRQKKVSPLLKEEYHQYCVAYNRLLQWRFANARAEASTAAVTRAAQGKLMNGWVRISVMRKMTLENRSEVQRMKQRMKLWHVLRSNIGMLNEWCRIEGKNVEAVGRVVRKLSAVSLCLPLVHNAEADVMSVNEAISTATEVMENIKPNIMDMYDQVEKTCFLLTELSAMLKQYKQFFQQLEKPVALVASQEAEEKSLRAHHIQLVKEVKERGKEEGYCMELQSNIE